MITLAHTTPYDEKTKLCILLGTLAALLTNSKSAKSRLKQMSSFRYVHHDLVFTIGYASLFFQIGFSTEDKKVFLPAMSDWSEVARKNIVFRLFECLRRRPRILSDNL